MTGSVAGQRGHRDREGIHLVALAAVAGGQLTDAAGQLGRHVDHLDAVSGQPSGQRLPQPLHALDRPAGMRPATRKSTQFAIAIPARRHPLLAQPSMPGVHRGR
jgi:hypothetical protein